MSREARHGLAFALAVCIATPGVAFADTSSLPSAVAARSRLVLRVEGDLAHPDRDALVALIGLDLRQPELEVVWDDTSPTSRTSVDVASTDPRTLMLAVLDTRGREAWQLSIIDVARGRAITRALAGDSGRNAADLEAVASIISSAAHALLEGLEVASRPIDEVVAPEERPVAAPLATSAVHSDAPAKVAFHGSLSIGASSFARSAPASFGADLSGGARYRRAGARVSGEIAWPSTIDASQGSFSVQRSSLALTMGLTWPVGQLELEPELGLRGELLRRIDTRASPPASARDDARQSRLGAAADVRLRWPLSRIVALEWVVGLTYFPQSIQYVASGTEPSAIAEPWRWVGSTQLGFDLHTP